MMMTKTTRGAKRLAILLAVALMVGGLDACATQRAAVDYDFGVDFSKYRTYTWKFADAAVPANLEDPRVSPLVRERMRAAVDQALLAKGLVKREPSDFVITLRIALGDRQQVHYWGPHADPLLWRHGWGRWPYYGPFGYDPFFAYTTVSIVTEATLAIDMFDAETKQPIWHGHATRVVGRDDIHPTDIQRMVDAILADFPPSLTGVAPPLL